MSEDIKETEIKEEEKLDEEIAKEPVPFNFFMPVVKAIENRVDYNFNTIIQLSLLLEYLYENLEQQGIKIELDENFQEFQDKRLEEMKTEFIKAQQEQEEKLDINLKDD